MKPYWLTTMSPRPIEKIINEAKPTPHPRAIAPTNKMERSLLLQTNRALTTMSPRPSEKIISVADGRKDAMRISPSLLLPSTAGAAGAMNLRMMRRKLGRIALGGES